MVIKMQVRIIGGEKLVAPVAQALTKQGAAVTTTADFSGTLAPETTLVWLPNPLDPVGDLVADLVALVDRSPAPKRIVMHGVPGTADDASPEQVGAWFQTAGTSLVMEHLYAVKMIDELEHPYVIVRTPPVTGRGGNVKGEGEPIQQATVGQEETVALITTAVTTEQYVNQSVGLG
ncbi:hypothetical protein ACWNPI_10430 [Limosilactobacillus fermentum]